MSYSAIRHRKRGDLMRFAASAALHQRPSPRRPTSQPRKLGLGTLHLATCVTCQSPAIITSSQLHVSKAFSPHSFCRLPIVVVTHMARSSAVGAIAYTTVTITARHCPPPATSPPAPAIQGAQLNSPPRVDAGPVRCLPRPSKRRSVARTALGTLRLPIVTPTARRATTRH